MKKKLIIIGLAAVLVLALGTTAIFAASDQIPSAKAAFFTDDVKVATYVAGDDGDTGWVDILSTQIKTGDPKDLIIDVSAECALVTDVKLSGKTGSEGTARILVRVKVDNNVAVPAEVTFANRILEIKGDLSHPAGSLLPDHWIEIFLETCNANAFNFAIENVGSGVHDVVVQAKLQTDEKGLQANAEAWIGYASVVVDEVQFKGINIGS
jgi:hypothetical protein